MRRIFLPAILFTFLLSAACSEKVSAPIPGPASFSWGQASDKTISNLSASGSMLESEEGAVATLSYPVSQDPELEESALFQDAEKPEEPYTVRLYSNEGKLSIVRIQRRDTTENVDAFMKVIKELYDLESPAIDKPGNDEKTETGNVIRSSEQIFENQQYVVRLNRTSVTATEVRIKGGLNDQVELQIYAKAENTGISAAALDKE